MTNRSRLILVVLLWVAVLFGILVFILNRLTDAGFSSDKKLISDSRLNHEVIPSKDTEVTHKVYFDIEIDGKPIGKLHDIQFMYTCFEYFSFMVDLGSLL
ncbi:peptidyl-prolyl cis-trans isomerase CYP19-4-like [Olea europaea subsp. europaea]|uniref:Peptidyl-prolyl cis-trans isomerase CYP19-4-like n=1 Tax=Olea europaea subsp. europaea TaxID=158383 RepID=A0A8S0T470_OLEEU|nr:peptidyl-prolyl cis-trans isomerase CYP19-4-like [Olea europaea subsp. europaea]